MQPYEMMILAAALALAAALLLRRLLRPKAKERRHRRKQDQARRVLAKINTIPLMPQRLAYLRKIDPMTFEELLLEAFERRGHVVQRNASYSGDGGLDGSVAIGGETYLLQAKRYAKHINRAHVAAFSAVVAARNCRGIFIHTGRTGAGAKDVEIARSLASACHRRRIARRCASHRMRKRIINLSRPVATGVSCHKIRMIGRWHYLPYFNILEKIA